ncbi:hypothetical protein ACFY03_15660 [Micromonospora chersina]
MSAVDAFGQRARTFVYFSIGGNFPDSASRPRVRPGATAPPFTCTFA